MKNRFKVIEYSSGFALEDTHTGEEAWMSDGVDMLFTPNGKAISPGSKTFVRKLQSAMNCSESETLEAYFPETYDKENAD